MNIKLKRYYGKIIIVCQDPSDHIMLWKKADSHRTVKSYRQFSFCFIRPRSARNIFIIFKRTIMFYLNLMWLFFRVAQPTETVLYPFSFGDKSTGPRTPARRD